MGQEFKAFLLRGNVIDLAVAVVIGAAFGAVITSLVENIITPIIGVFGGVPDFSALTFTINGSQFGIGAFINAVLAFIVIAAVIFFVVVVPMNRLMARVNPPEEPAAMRECPHCLSSIQPAAHRCAYCTQEVPPEEPATA